MWSRIPQILVLSIGMSIVPAIVSAQTETVTVSVTDGEQIRCVTDSIVTVAVAPNPNRTWTEMQLFWTDDSEPIVIRPGESLERSHSYALSTLFEECEYDCNFSNGFCRTITVVAQYAEGSPENNSLRLTFKLPPRPFFFGATSCIGNAIAVENMTCPSNDEDMTYSWDFGGSQTSTEEEPGITFTEAGQVPVTLTATNLCGSQSIQQTFNVIEPATAVALADSNITSSNGDNYVLCGQGFTGTRLVATGSPNASSYQWSDNGGVQFENNERSGDTVRVTFNGPGMYTVTLEVDNACESPSTADFTFEVVEAQSLSLRPQNDACNELMYTPDPLLEEATYTINGQAYAAADFPVALMPSATPYAIEARLMNPCGEQVRRDTVRVITPEPVSITSPAADTSVCEGAASFELRASQTGGVWRRDGIPTSATFDPADFNPGSFLLEYQVGSGNCATGDEVVIRVLTGPQIDIGDDAAVCIDSDPLTLLANETGGVWSGVGITDTAAGTFDPLTAGVGTFTVQYQFERNGDGCEGQAQKEIEVVDLPVVSAPDTVLVCNDNDPIELAPLLNPDQSPEGGNLRFSGPGVTDGAFDSQAAGGEGFYPVEITYTIDPGCSQNTTSVLRVDALTVPTTPPDTTLCSNQGTFTLQASPAGGEWRNASGRNVNPNLNLAVLPTGDQTFTYVLSPGTSCESEDDFTLTLIDASGVQAGDDIFVCETQTSVDLPDQTGIWTGPALTGRTVDLTTLDVGVQRYTLTKPDLPAACNSDELELTIGAEPEAAFTPDSTGCVGTAVAMNNQTTGADRYSWTFGDGNSSSGASPTHTYQSPGTYDITLRAASVHPLTNDDLCAVSATGEIRIFEPPSLVAFDPSRTEGCGPLQVNFTNLSEGERLSFQWDFGLDTTVTTTHPAAISFPPAMRDTTYAVRLSVTNGCGDEAAVDSIRVLAQPIARFASEIRSEYCSGEVVTFGHRSLADQLWWDFGNGTTYSGFEPPTQRYQTGIEQNDTVNISLQAFNECGEDTATQELVIVPTDARASITVADDQPCLGDTVILESLSRPLDARVEWLLPDGSRREGLRVPVVFDSVGPQRIEAQVFSCGQDSTSLVLDVQPIPNLTLTAPAQTCPGELITLRMQTNGQPTFISVGEERFLQTTQVQTRLDSLGTYTVAAMATSGAGCTTMRSQTIEVVGGPRAAIGPIDSVCTGVEVALVSESQGGASCVWRLPDGTRRSGCTIQQAFTESGAGSVSLLVTSEIGCRDSVTAPVFVRPTPRAAFDIDVLEECTPSVIRLVDRSDTVDELAWWLPDGSVKYGDSVTFTQSVAGEYVVELRAGNEGICFDRTTRSWTAFGSPELTIDKEQGCTQAQGFLLRADVEPSAAVMVTGPGYEREGTLHTGLQPGEYLLTAQTDNGCFADSLTTIPAVDELTAAITSDDSLRIELGESFPVAVDVNLAEATIAWSPAGFVVDPDQALTTARPLRSGALIVQVTDDRGCTVLDTIQVTVDVNRDLGVFIPNAFTPNGDGTNDVFMVRSSNPGLVGIPSLRVYGPGGDLVFERQDGKPNESTHGWDGRFRGQPVQAGVYVYVAELHYIDGEVLRKKGDVTLIR
jgi:gliding motility-associated-like protein